MLRNLNICIPLIAVLSIILPLSDQLTHAVVFKYRTRFGKVKYKILQMEVSNNVATYIVL